LSLLSSKSLETLQNCKNLLAFSAGVDSSALFFLLHEAKIDFDIALVNYQTRPRSDEEALHAQKLADTYDKTAYIKTVTLPQKNFEHNARQVRYDFFAEIITQKGYDNLITAHQLNDRTEWFLMQFTKGAGAVELSGFEEIEKREHYTLVRPLIHTPKEMLLAYLHENKHPYFLDESNQNEQYTRNYFRKHFADELVQNYAKGIQKSFAYLHEDKKALFQLEVLKKIEALTILKSSQNEIRDIRQIDKVLKQMSYILSKAQKEEIVKQKDIVISDRFAVVWEEEKIYIAPFFKTVMPKQFKEACRVRNIPAKIRPYLYSIDFDFMKW